MKLILLCVWAKRSVLGSAKTTLELKYEIKIGQHIYRAVATSHKDAETHLNGGHNLPNVSRVPLMCYSPDIQFNVHCRLKCLGGLIFG